MKGKAVAERVLKMLHQDGVNIWRLMQVHQAADVAASNASFTGSAADNVMGRFGEYAEAVESANRDDG